MPVAETWAKLVTQSQFDTNQVTYPNPRILRPFWLSFYNI